MSTPTEDHDREVMEKIGRRRSTTRPLHFINIVLEIFSSM